VTNDEKICEIASFILLESIRWLYFVPSFKNLQKSDQVFLIEQSWSILFLLTSAEMKKFLIQDETYSFNEENQYPLFQSIIKDLISHTIDQTEYTLLKLIIIFNTRKFIYFRASNMGLTTTLGEFTPHSKLRFI
jgi:hypothetical protein